MYFTKAIKRLTILAALALTCQTVDAQQIKAARSHYSTEDGLCSNAISMLYQDDLGYIWIATWNGLSRFDGYNFYNYKTGNGSRIKNLHNRIRDLAIDQSQNIWLLMYDNRVFVLDRATDQITNPFKAYKGNYEFRARCPLLTSSTGKVFASMNDGHLYMMELDRKGLKSEQIAADGVAITCLVEGFEDEIWIGTKKGIHRLDRTNLSIERNAILQNESITSLHAHGFSIYAGTASGAIYSFVYGQEPKLLRKPTGMEVFSLFVDSKELIWFCDDRMGASQLNPKTGKEKFFQQYVPVPEYDGRGGVFNESNGTVWMVMNHGGFGYYNREQDVVEYFHNDPSNPWNLANTVYTALELPEGVVWESTSQQHRQGKTYPQRHDGDGERNQGDALRRAAQTAPAGQQEQQPLPEIRQRQRERDHPRLARPPAGPTLRHHERRQGQLLDLFERQRSLQDVARRQRLEHREIQPSERRQAEPQLEQSLPGHRRQIRQPLDSHLWRRREHDEDGKRQAHIPLSRQRHARLS